MTLKQAEEVRGFDRLSREDQRLFQEYLKNFYAAWEFPEQWIPVKVVRKYDRGNGSYLRVDFTGSRWLHVKNAATWY
jgi:hypothetical protein